MPLAALDQHLAAERRLRARFEALAAIDHHKGSGRQIQSPVHQPSQEDRDGPSVLRVRLHEAQEHLVPVERRAQSKDHLVLGEALPVQEHRHHVVLRQVALLERLQLACRRPLELP